MAVYLLKLWIKSKKALGWAMAAQDRCSKFFPRKKMSKKIFGLYSINLDLREHVQRRIFFFGAYEAVESYLLLKILNEDAVLVDAGANIGYYSLLASTQIKTGKIFAFEPVPKNFESLSENINSNHLSARIKPIPQGLWNSSDLIKFHLQESMRGNSGSFTAAPHADGQDSYEAPVVRLDDFAAERGVHAIDFIKMDIEGAELNALKGAQNILERHRPSLLLEVNRSACAAFGYDPQDLFSFLSQFKYRFFAVKPYPEKSDFIDGFDGINQCNVFVLSERHEKQFIKSWDEKKVISHFIDWSRT